MQRDRGQERERERENKETETGTYYATFERSSHPDAFVKKNLPLQVNWVLEKSEPDGRGKHKASRHLADLAIISCRRSAAMASGVGQLQRV